MQGILFKPEMIKAIMEGRKTMTRRIIKSKHESGLFEVSKMKDGTVTGITSLDWDERPKNDCMYDIRPKYKVGEVIYVKEGYEDYMGAYNYKLGGYGLLGEKWKNSMFMPAKAARTFLRITNVRIEKLGDLTYSDAIDEGIAQITKDKGITWKYGIPDKDGCPGGCDIGWPWTDWELTPEAAFRKLWEKINKSYDPNLWVFVYEFEKVFLP